MTPTFARFTPKRLGRVALGIALAGCLLWQTPVNADLFRVNGSITTLQPGGVWRGVDVAYDPANDVYLVVTAYGNVRGVFTNSLGYPITPAFTIHSSSFGHFPNAEYSPHVSNGNGGSGGFLVVWNDGAHGDSIQGRIVSIHAPGRLVSGVQLLSDPSQGPVYFENRPVLAYSRTSHRFLVVWTTRPFGLQGRLVATNGSPVSGVLRFEEGGSRDPAVVWNPATDEFGLGNSAWGGGGAFASFRRIGAGNGLVSPRSTFGFSGGTYATGIDVNAANQYVFTWGLHPGTTSATFDPWGNLLGTRFVSARIGGDLSMGLSYNPTTNTFLAVSSDWYSYDVAGAELASNGAPLTPAVQLTAESRASYYPLPAARLGTNEWNVVYSPDYLGAMSQIVVSLPGGGSTAPPPSGGGSSSGCSTPDPFASIGGGTCVNGGWMPSGSTSGGSTPPPPPPPAPSSSTGCSTPDPFASIGGGTCVNGGWVPSGGGGSSSPAPAPAPAPAPSTCTSPSPGAGWACVNGGWLPPGHPGAVGATSTSSSSGTSGGCSTPDPFVSLGGGTCVNGGWTPGTCTGSDPFAAIGGGVCINGGWVPKGM